MKGNKMPNWCENTLTVSGDTAEVLRFTEQAKKPHSGFVTNYSDGKAVQEYRDDLSGFFWNFVAPPVESQTAEDYFGNDRSAPHYWYEWNVNNWGTKWDTGIGDDLPVITYGDKSSICITFDTAWGPAVPAYIAMAEQYPSLNISVEYSELGMGFWGSVTFAGGEIVDEEEGEVDHEWLLEKYGECPEVAWGNLEDGEACEECGAKNDYEPVLTEGGEE
jgi:hypothetical protein